MINYFWLEIKTNNINKFLKEIIKNNINILNIKYSEDQVRLKVTYNDYQKLKELQIFKEISIIKISGKKKILEDLKKYKISVLTFIMGIFLVIFLSNFTFFIEIDTNNNKLKNLIKEELVNHDITIFSLKKSRSSLDSIKEKIKNNHLENIEWLEIENRGVITKVKVIERIRNNPSSSSSFKDVVATKNGYIRKIVSSKGEIIKNTGDYVKKGEIIISGNIHRNEKPVSKVVANGKVYAEVWYIVKLNGNLNYTKVKDTEKGNLKLVLKTGGLTFDLFKLKKDVPVNKSNTLFKNKLFSLSLEEEKTYHKIKSKYTLPELKNILEVKARNSILRTLDKDEYIIQEKTLKKTKENDKIEIEVFFKVYEDIAKQVPIKKEIEKTK